MITVEELAEEIFQIFAAMLPTEEQRDALQALEDQTGAGDASMQAALGIVIARLRAAEREARRWKLNDRKREFERVLSQRLEDGDVITPANVARLAEIYQLIVSTDGEIRDALQ
jgi:hypothetical protein